MSEVEYREGRVNIDERLEALTQSLELLTLDVRSLQDSVSKLQDTSRTLVESVTGLVRVAQIHENRLTRLEGTAD